jgi:hypothetical protein
MNRRDALQGIATALLAAGWPAARVLAAGLGFAWDRVPAIAPAELMARVRALLGETRKATTFWYRWYIPAA